MSNIDILYQSLIKRPQFKDLSIDKFKKDMQDDNNRKALFGSLSKIPNFPQVDYDTFTRDMGYGYFDGGLPNIYEIDKQQPKWEENKPTTPMRDNVGMMPSLQKQQSETPLDDQQVKNVMYGDVPSGTKIGDVQINRAGTDFLMNKNYGKKPEKQPEKNVNIQTPALGEEMSIGKFSPIYAEEEQAPEVREHSFIPKIVQAINAGASGAISNLASYAEDFARQGKNMFDIPIVRDVLPTKWLFGKEEEFFKGVKDYFKNDANKSRVIAEIEGGKDFTQLWKEGKYMDAAQEVYLKATESLPLSLAVIITTLAGMPNVGMGLMYASSAGGQMDQLSSRTDMTEFQKQINAHVTGLIEALSEKLGDIPIANWLKKIYSTGGKAAVNQASKNIFRSVADKAFSTNGLLFPIVSEGIEGSAGQFGQNAVSYVTGETDKLDLMKDVGKSFVYGSAGGSQFAAAGAPGLIKNTIAKKNITKKAQQASDNVDNLFDGYDTQALKGALKGKTEDEKIEVLNSIATGEFTDEQKDAIFDYYSATQRYEALKGGELKAKINNSNEQGKEIFLKSQGRPFSGTLYNVYNKINQYEAGLGEYISSLSNDEIIDLLNNGSYDEDIDMVLRNYVSTRSMFDGAVSAMREQADTEIAQIHSEIDATTRKDGTRLIVQTEEINKQPGQTFYVTDGNIALDKHGNVIRNQSDTTLTVTNEAGETQILPINAVATASYQNAQDTKNKIAADITARYEDMLTKELDTNPVEVKKQEGAEITWYENGQPRQGIVIDKANGYVSIQEGNKVILKNEQELNEQLKNPTELYHINDTMQLYFDGVAYDAEITSEKDPDGRYTVNIPNHPEMINHDLTAEEITSLQTAPVADETAPAQSDKTSAKEGENATIPTGKEEQKVREYPKNKKGEIDFDNMDIATTFDYLKETEGEDVALEGLNLSLTAIQKKIQENDKVVQDLEAKTQTELKKATTIQEHAKIKAKQKEILERLTAERIELDKQEAEIRGLLPQTPAPVAVADAPVSVEEITPEQQAEQDFIATLPKIASGDKAGRVNTKKLTPEQAFQYTKIIEGTETAIKDIKDEMSAIYSDIRAREKKLQTATGTAKIEIREDIKGLKERKDNLKTILDREAPGLEAEMKAQAEKKAKIEAEVKAKNEAIAEARKNRVLTEEEKNNMHNSIVQLIRKHNELPANYTQKKRVIFAEISKKASQLGYSTTVFRGGQFSVVDKEGKPIRTIAQRTSQEEINEHQLLTEYEPEFQEFALKLMQSMPETLDFPNTNVEKAVKDITAGIKSVAANRMLDRMEEMYSSGEIIIRATAFTPEAMLDIPSYFALFEQETDNEIHILNEMLQHAPEEFYFEIYDDLITDDNIDYINQLFEQYGYEQQQERETRTYPGDEGTSSQEAIGGNAEEGISEEQEPGEEVKAKVKNETPSLTEEQSVETLTPKVDTSTPKVDTSAKQPTLSREPKEVLQERKRLATEEKNRLTKLLSGKAIDMFREQSENELEAGTFDPTQTNNRIAELSTIEKELDAQIKLAEQAEKKGVEEAQGQQEVSFEEEKPVEPKSIEDIAKEAVKKNEQSKVSQAQQEADEALKDFLDAFNDLNSDNLGIVDNTAEKQAKMLVAGTKMVGAFTKLGIYKFADVVKNIASKGIQITEDLLSAIKKAYGAFAAENDIDALDDMKTVRAFTINDITNNQKQQQDEPKANPETPYNATLFEVESIESAARNAKDSKQAGAVVERCKAVKQSIDKQIEELQLQLEAYETGEIVHEYPNKVVEKLIEKDVREYSKALAQKLGFEHDTDKKGKPEYANGNIAPAGGDATFILWKPNSEYGIYVSISYDPDYKNGYDDYKATQILWRATSKANKYTGFGNQYAQPGITVGEFAKLIEREVKNYDKTEIPQAETKESDYTAKGVDGAKLIEMYNKGFITPEYIYLINVKRIIGNNNEEKIIEGTIDSFNGQVFIITNTKGDKETLLPNEILNIKGKKREDLTPKPDNLPKNDVSLNDQKSLKEHVIFGTIQKTNDNGSNSKQRVLQGSNKRLSGTAQPDLFSGVDSGEGTGGSVGTQSNAVSGADATEQQPTGRTGSVLSGNVDVLAPALVPFNAEDNDTQSFNQSRKYDDNIAAVETLITLVKENRKATPDEKAILSNYVGFGGLKDIVLNPESAEGWKESNLKYRAQVKRIVELAAEFDQVTGSSDSLAKIKGSILNAHFTSSSVIRSVYDGIQKLGFKGGRMLEPSAGIGNFITYAPERIKANSNITAVELDNLTGNILKYLHDDVNVKVTGIQDAQIPNNSQDLVISNVPFGNYKIFDKALKGDKAEFQNRIHNYFFAKAIDMAREGGIIAFVTSKGVMDAAGNESLRKYLNDNAEFLGAVRLPNNAFKNNANTEVVTDIIFLKKNTTGAKNNPDFVSIKQVEATHKDGEKQMVNVNNYFVENPQNMLGNIVAGGLYSREDYTVENKTGYDLSKAIKNALPAGVYEKVNSKIGLQANDSQQTIDAIKEGNIEVTGGRVVRKEEGQLIDIRINEPQGKIEHYIRLRNALMNLIYSEYLGKPDSELNAIRQQLNTEYDTFVKKHGKLSKNAIKIAKQDADGFNVLSLEVADKKDGKADIFRQRTIQPIQNKLTAESVDEAIVISLYENASIDVERIAELLNKTVPEVLQQAKGKIFEQPEGGFVTREEYLSGNVKAKLRQAQEAVDKGFSEFAYNVEQLMDVIPADIPAMHIEARLGSRWIPQEVYTEFAQHLFNTPSAKVIYQRSIDAYSNNGRIETVEAHSKWGTARRNGSDILLDALHINPPKIFDTIKEFGQEKRVLNQDETKKAVEKYEEIRAEFENWVYKAEERRTLLARIYNEKYNTTVKRSYNGDHLNIAGINGVELRPHQKDAVWMLLQNNGGIIDHLVGAGKTLVMVAGTMEMKRTGIAKKPMIIALKSTIPQIVETYRKAYPMAKILAPLEKDFTKDNRRKLFSQIANNEWDVIIMSHENYGKIPHEADIQRDFLRAEMQEIEDERGELEAAGEKQALKGLEIRLKNLEARLEKISDIDKDNSLTFEQMGIDHIMVDESQQFKNLSYVTKQRGVAGLSKAEGSKRAFNLFIGIRYLQQKYGEDKGTTFLSGTPISNSMVEMYLLLKYLRPGKMAELGFNSFDAWATTFASPNSDIEFTVTGDFKSKTRFREFINVPELSMLYTEIADIRTDANTPLDKPKMKGGGYSVVEIKMSDDQIEYGQRLMEFARTKDGHHIGMTLTKNQETAAMLLATNLSSKMAIDMRLIDSSYDYDPNGKIAKLVDNVERIYNETAEYKGTQLIFSDLGTPKNKTNKTAGLRDYMEDEMGVNLDTLNEIFGNPDEAGYKYPSINSIREKLSSILELTDAEIDNIISESEQSEGAFNVYGEVRKRLVEKGIPEEQVVFIHDYNSQRAKEKLFKQVKNGEIRIVLGSTQKLGTGVNVQDRVVAVHHLDVPWTPASMEQRNGRAIRQGNWVAKNHYGNELPIYAYATERTLDAYKYQLLQTKQRFLDQVKSGDVEERTVRESDGDSESGVGYAELVAMLSGNTDILLKAKLETLVQKLTKSKRNYLSEIYEAQDKKQKLTDRIPVIESNIAKTTENIEIITNSVQYAEDGKMIVADINGETLIVKNDKGKVVPTERVDYGKRAVEIAKAKLNGASYENIVKLFSLNGFDFYGSKRNEIAMNNGMFGHVEKRYITLRAKNGVEYNVTYSETPGVLLNNIQKVIQGIPALLTTQNAILDKANKDLTAYQEIINKGTEWEKEPELTKALNELKEVNKRLDDISTKDQPKTASESDAVADDKIRIGDLIFTIGKESFVTMAEAKNKAGEDVAVVRINSQLNNDDYTRRVKPIISRYFGEWNSSNKVIMFNNIKQAENFKITIENEFKKENREYEAPQLHTGTTMKRTSKKEVSAMVEQLFKTGLASEVRMVTPEEIAGILEGNEQLHTVYHGSPHSFDRFSLNHIGTGEGQQAYGWGLYFTDKEDIARAYAERLSNRIDKQKNFIQRLFGNSKNKNIYKVNVEGDNWISWDKPISESQATRLAGAIYKQSNHVISTNRAYNALHTVIPYKGKQLLTGKEVYKFISKLLKGDKNASIFLNKNGFSGIKYPAKYHLGNSNNKDFNYVVFDENAISIKKKVQFFRTPTGTIYGFVKDGVVYLNSDTPNLNSPIHEFGHLWIDAIEGSELYDRGADLVKETTYWERVNADPNYKDLSETARIKEAMAMAIGDNGESVVNDNGLKAKLKRWISDVWKRIGSAFGINNLTSEQISNLSFKDFVDIATSEVLSGENLTENELSNPLRRLDKAYEAKEYEQKQEISIREALADNDIPKPDDVWKDADTIFKPKRIVFNEDNIAVSLYKHGIKRINEIHKLSDHLLSFEKGGFPIINKEKASAFRDAINPEIDKHVGMLQQVKHLSTPAAQRIINELIEDARLSKDYYDRYAAGEDVWRTEKAPRFQIIGEQGAENLDKAEEATTRLDNLKVAKEMENPLLNTKVIDKSGNPLTVYHGTPYGGFKEFDFSKGNNFFVDNKNVAEVYANDKTEDSDTRQVYEVKLKINNPSILDLKGESWSDITSLNLKDENGKEIIDTDEYVEYIKRQKQNDGVIILNVSDSMGESDIANNYIAFDKAQINPKQYTPQEIRNATGWEKGADGLWRYETAKHTIHPQLQEYMDKSSDGFIKWINARLNHGLPVNLQDIYGIKDETLKALPQLRTIPVKIVSDAEIDGSIGLYSPETKTILINSKIINDQDKVLSVLEHEVQHAIQHIEGFAKGGSPAAFSQSRDNINRLFKDIENAFDKLGYEDWLINGGKVDNTPNRNFNGMYSFAETQSKSVRDRMVSKLDEANKVINENKSIFGNYNIYDNIKDEELYRRLAGEVEARNAQTRMNYTDEQRRNTLLSETADVAPEDQIIIMDGLGVSMSMTEDEVQAKADKIINEGLKSVIPDYVDFLKNVYDAVPDSARRFIIDRSKDYGWDIGRATEEYLASFVKGVSPAELDKIAELAGLQDLATSEIKMAFWDNFNPKDDSPEYIAKRSLAVNDSRDGVLPKHPTIKQVQEAYERIVTPKRKYNKSNLLKKETGKHAAFRVEESYANSLASLRVFMDIIGEVPDKYNPYYLMQLYTSAASTTMDRYEKKEFKDMMTALTQLNKELKQAEGLNYLSRDYKGEKGEINRGTLYALAKAGLDRNERLARKNAADQLQPEYNKLSKQLLKGEIDQEAYEDMLSILSDKENELAEDINAKHDFGGLTGLAKLVGSDAENFEDIRGVVEDIVAEAEGAVNTDDFWTKTKAATSYVLTYQYNRGMMSKELYEEILEMEPHYLPLRGYDEATAGDVYEYFTSFKGEFNPVLKKAKGHEHLPENPFAHIKSMTASGVLQAEKNRAKQALLNLVENNKNDLVTAGKSWIRNIGTEEMPEWEDAYPVIPEDATPEQVTEAINDFENKMKELAAEGKAAIKSKKLKLNLPIGKGVPEEHTIKVRRNGEERTMYVNGNPRLAQAINGMLNPDATDTATVLKVVKAINRGMSANFTSRNLEFAITNTLRDLHMAIALSGIEEGIGYSANLAKNAVVAQRTLASHIFGSGKKGKYQDYLQEFLENGGQTGFVNLRSVERNHKDIKKLERELRKKDPFAIPKWIFGQIEDVNQMGELISRFATYITSREAGRSVTRSSVDAKNITLNFNQKGTGELGASWFQNLILFFNPAMQALYRANQARQKHPARFWGVMGAHAAAGAMVPMLTFIIAGMMGDDDDKKEMEDAYWNTSTWIRRNNLMIWIPKTKSFITIPLGQELRWAYSIGEIAFTKAMGKDAYGKNVGAEMVGAVTALLPVDMFGASHWYMPGFATPIYESSINENFMGNPIYKSTPWNENDPSHTKAYSRTWKGFVNVSKKINELTGGDDVTKGKVDINPAVAQHLVEGYLGGLVSVYLRGADVAASAMKGEEYTVNEVPFLRRVYKVSDKTMVDRSVKREYFDILNDLEKGYGHKELRWRQKNKEYETKYNNAIKDLQEQGVELTPETTSGILTPQELKDWQEYQEKYQELQSTVDAQKMQVFKEAKKVRDKWEKDGEEFSDTYLMQQVLERVKAIDEAEEANY